MPGDTDLSRREREQLQHKQQIVDVAMKLFSVRGFHTVSMQEIAAESEFAIGTLYKFFPSKEALYNEIMDQSCRRILEIVNPILDGDADEREKISGMIRAAVGIARKNTPAIRLFLQTHPEGTLADDCVRPTEADIELHETLQKKVEDVISSGMRNGVFRNMDPAVGALAFHATLRTLVVSAARASQEDLLERRLADFEELLFNGILLSRENNHA
jgi:AcrR family transcriptional regulator